MPPIDHGVFLMRIAQMMDEAANAAGHLPDGGFQTPMSTLNGPPRPFSEVFGPRGRLLGGVARQAEAEGQLDLAAFCLALDAALEDGSLEWDEAGEDGARVAEYVYPIV